jgi:hypothetical protein
MMVVAYMPSIVFDFSLRFHDLDLPELNSGAPSTVDE